MAASYASAAQKGGAVCFLSPPVMGNEALFALVPTAGVERLESDGLSGIWFGARWRAADARRRTRGRMASAASSFWLEMYRELRRHVADRLLPYPLRSRLRSLSQGAFERSRRIEINAATVRLPRHLLRERVRLSLPADRLEVARAQALEVGIAPDAPVVAVEASGDVERMQDAFDGLREAGCQIVRVGTSDEPLRRTNIVDLASPASRHDDLDVFVLLTCRFLVCTSLTAQRVAYLTNTPCLTLDVADPVAGYPIRDDGIYLLATAIDLGSGTKLGLDQMLGERYLRDASRFGHRRNTAAEILLAVREMRSGLEYGWRESGSQARYRELVAEAGEAAASQVPRLAAWGPQRGFMGDGRLALVQADRWL